MDMHDVAIAIVWQLITCVVVRSAIRTSQRLFPTERGSALVLHSSILSISFCLIGLYIVGGVGLMNRWSAMMARRLVKVPFFCMVNLIAERPLVVELIQEDFTGERLAAEALKLLNDQSARLAMRAALGQLAETLAGSQDPMEAAASEVERFLVKEMVHVS